MACKAEELPSVPPRYDLIGAVVVAAGRSDELMVQLTTAQC